MSYLCIYSEVRVDMINPGRVAVKFYFHIPCDFTGWICLVWRAKGRDIGTMCGLSSGSGGGYGYGVAATCGRCWVAQAMGTSWNS